jgi:hypothetical protein
MIAMPWRFRLRTIWRNYAHGSGWACSRRRSRPPPHGSCAPRPRRRRVPDNLPFAEEIASPSAGLDGGRELVGFLGWLTIPLPDIVVWDGLP